MIYLDSFRFPTFEQEDDYLAGYFAANPYSMNVLYPFKVLSVKGLHSLDFSEITILYGGNGSGKSTALNAISNMLWALREIRHTIKATTSFMRNILICAITKRANRTTIC